MHLMIFTELSMATKGSSSLYIQRRQRHLHRRKKRMIEQRSPQHEAELEEAKEEDIFLNLMDKSTAFFDKISTSDSVSTNPYVLATNHIKVNTSTKVAANPSTFTPGYEFNDTRDASSTVPSSNMIGLSLDTERQAASPMDSSSSSGGKPIHNSPAVSVESIKMLDSDFEEISLSSAEHEDEDIAAEPHESNQDITMLEEKQNTSPAATVKSNVTMDIIDQALFDTDSDEIEEMEELRQIDDVSTLTEEVLHHRQIDDVSTLTEETYSPIITNENAPFFSPYSSQPFSLAAIQADGMQSQGELAPNRRRSKSAEDMFMQRLEEIAAERSIIAKIAIKFEDVVMAVCGQEEEVLYVVVEEDDEDNETEEQGIDNKSTHTKPSQVCVSEAKGDMLETPVHEKAKEENEDTALGMAGLLKTIQISRVGKLTTRDRVLVPLYERAVLDLVNHENQVMRKSRAIEIGKRTLASCNRSKDGVTLATNIAFLEVELKETKRKVAKSRESLQQLYEAFSLKTQKAIDDLQMDGFR